jgi:hypothetical protein
MKLLTPRSRRPDRTAVAARHFSVASSAFGRSGYRGSREENESEHQSKVRL